MVFPAHQAHDFTSHVLQQSYAIEDESFKGAGRVVPLSVPIDADIIAPHMLCKIKVDEDKALKLKSCIDPHGNEDCIRCIRNELGSDCSMWAPVSVRILTSVDSIRSWRISRTDVKIAFIQTGAAERDV